VSRGFSAIDEYVRLSVTVSEVGCADLSSPFGGWWQRDGPLSATSGCGQSGHIWHWTCSDDFKWIPDRPVVNCTEAHSSGSGSQIFIYYVFAPIIIITSAKDDM